VRGNRRLGIMVPAISPNSRHRLMAEGRRQGGLGRRARPSARDVLYDAQLIKEGPQLGREDLLQLQGMVVLGIARDCRHGAAACVAERL